MNLNQSNLIKIALTVAIGFAVCYLLQKYYSKVSTPTTEEFYDNHDSVNTSDTTLTDDDHSEEPKLLTPHQLEEQQAAEMGFDSVEDMKAAGKGGDPTVLEEFENGGNQYPKDCFPKDQLSPSELLPGSSDTQFALLNPDSQGELSDQNFLDAGYHTGINTVGQTLRNANYQVRSEPPNPQVKVSPWLQTTIEPDTNRKPLEIGGSCN